jgi:DNA-binding XRE family transcriptional regulator
VIKMGRTLEQILETEKPAVKAQAEAQAKAMLLNIQLAKIRALAQKTQAEMAETLDVKQPTVAGIERVGQDLKLSTLKRYVEAAGGKVRLDIELPDGNHHEFLL